MNITILPRELNEKILFDSGLRPKDIGNSNQVCQLFKEIIENSSKAVEFWDTYEKIYTTRPSCLKGKDTVIDYIIEERTFLEELPCFCLQSLSYCITPFINSDNPKIQFELAGVTYDDKKAFVYMECAAKQGLTKAQNGLGVYYYKGFGCEKDIEKAMTYLEMPAREGMAEAHYYMALCYYEKGNYPQAFNYAKLSADQKFSVAELGLANLYKNGIGCEKDFQKAFEYYQKAEDHAKSLETLWEAIFNLAKLYEEGLGCEQDLLEVKKCSEAMASIENKGKAPNPNKKFEIPRLGPSD